MCFCLLVTEICNNAIVSHIKVFVNISVPVSQYIFESKIIIPTKPIFFLIVDTFFSLKSKMTGDHSKLKNVEEYFKTMFIQS